MMRLVSDSHRELMGLALLDPAHSSMEDRRRMYEAAGVVQELIDKVVGNYNT